MRIWGQILIVSFVTMIAAPVASAGSGELLRAMNETRAAHGVGPLKANATLAKAARAHSRDMVRTDQFGHYGFVRRMQQHRVRGPYVGENLAWGVGASATAAQIVASWLQSPTHRVNLLNPRFQLVGLGLASGEFNGYAGATLVTANFSGR